MNKIESYNHDANADPVISYASDAEIEFADQLRQQLEERYLARDVPSSNCRDGTAPSLLPFDDAGGAP